MMIPSTTSLVYAPAPAITTVNSGGAVCKRGFSSTSGNTRRRHPNPQVAHHCRNEAPISPQKASTPSDGGVPSHSYGLFGHLGGLRDRPGGLASYPSGFPPVGSGASSGEASGGNRESEYTMLSGRKGLSSSESPLEATPAPSTGNRRIARRLSS